MPLISSCDLVPPCCVSAPTCSRRVPVWPLRPSAFCWLSISRFRLASSSSVNWSRASWAFSHWLTFSWYRCSVSASSSCTERVADRDSCSWTGQRQTIKCWMLKANANKMLHYLLLWVLEFLLQMFQLSVRPTHLFYRCRVLLFKYCRRFLMLLSLWPRILQLPPLSIKLLMQLMRYIYIKKRSRVTETNVFRVLVRKHKLHL